MMEIDDIPLHLSSSQDEQSWKVFIFSMMGVMVPGENWPVKNCSQFLSRHFRWPYACAAMYKVSANSAASTNVGSSLMYTIAQIHQL